MPRSKTAQNGPRASRPCEPTCQRPRATGASTHAWAAEGGREAARGLRGPLEPVGCRGMKRKPITGVVQWREDGRWVTKATATRPYEAPPEVKAAVRRTLDAEARRRLEELESRESR